jgi:hypothetical protein
MNTITRRLAPLVAGLSLVGALLPSTAGATITKKKDLVSALLAAVANAGTACDDSEHSRPFTRWLDFAEYKLAPGGDFEAGGPAWTLAGGAAVVGGNSPFAVGGTDDGSSLELPPGASATSPASCVTLTYPTLRFFAGSDRPGKVAVEVVYDDWTFRPGTVRTGDWSPSPVLLTGALTLDVEHVSIRLTNVGSRTVSVDDVYIDPYRRG